jgi:hypothetical protein
MEGLTTTTFFPQLGAIRVTLVFVAVRRLATPIYDVCIVRMISFDGENES